MSSPSVIRKVDSSGNVFGRGELPRRVWVSAPPGPTRTVGDTIEISSREQLIRSHWVKHDGTREHGALANPGGRPRTHAA